jgi:hypothetical protein
MKARLGILIPMDESNAGNIDPCGWKQGWEY